MAYETFDIDLAFGKQREDAFVRQLLATKVEHKADRLAARTGNIAIEFECRGTGGQIIKSGVYVQDGGEIWVTEFAKNRRLMVPTLFAKQLTKLAIKSGRHAWIGDGRNHHCALIPFGWFLNPPEEEPESA